MLPPASSLVVSLCQLQSLASSLPTEIFEGNTGRGPDLVWTTELPTFPGAEITLSQILLHGGNVLLEK